MTPDSPGVAQWNNFLSAIQLNVDRYQIASEASEIKEMKMTSMNLVGGNGKNLSQEFTWTHPTHISLSLGIFNACKVWNGREENLRLKCEIYYILFLLAVWKALLYALAWGFMHQMYEWDYFFLNLLKCSWFTMLF